MADKPKTNISSPPSSAKNVQLPSTRPTTSTSTAEQITAPPQYQPPRPRAAFSIFVDFPDCFIRFLEALMNDSNFAARDKKDIDDISTTLFEAYLRQSKLGKEQRPMWEEKAKSLLTDQKVSLVKAVIDSSYLSTLLCCYHISHRLMKELVS
jgi:hypothetical protein